MPEDSEEGLNHRALIEKIINGQSIGLNSSDSYLNKQIESRLDGSLLVPSRDTLGSMAVTQGDELNDLFSLETEGVAFLIHMVSDTEYHLYTTSVYLGERGEINSFTGKNKTPGNPTTPIGEYISLSRINEAKRLLGSTDIPVNQIAVMVGINDYNYFSKFFRIRVGMSPLKYRKNFPFNLHDT